MTETGEARVWRPGEVVHGLYEVLDVVHSGGMGLVHRVRHRGWSMDLAVKTPRPELVRTAHGRSAFEAEAGTWVRLGLHPHTVGCVYVRTLDGMPRVFAEWVDGGSLARAVHDGSLYRGGPRAALGRVLDVARQTAWGLAHAHDSGLVHQDVKPANVMLEPDGTAKVTDFGLAGARAASGETAVERPVGGELTAGFGGMTPAYCSPEQAAAAAGAPDVRLTAATDVWSWAVTVLEMFVGRMPTRYGQAAAEVLELHLAGGIGATHDDRVPAVPPAVAELLRRCLALDPRDRPAGFAEVAAAVGAAYEDALGEPHTRAEPQAARLLSDGLSNQALSLLDLGREAEAEELWRAAVTADPHHLPSLYNHGLHEWRSGRRTGEELVAVLEAAGAAEADPLLLGRVHLERHEDESAGELLRRAAARAAARTAASAAGAAGPEPSGSESGTSGSPDAAAAAAHLAEAEAALAVWRTRPPRPRHDLEGHQGLVSAVAVGADGTVLSGDARGGLMVWSPDRDRTGEGRRLLTRKGPRVTAVALDATGRLGVCLREDGTVHVWDLIRGRRRRRALRTERKEPRGVALAMSGDGAYVAIGSPHGTFDVHRTDGLRRTTVVEGHRAPVTSLALSEDGSRAVSASLAQGDGTVRAWDLTLGRCTGTLAAPDREGVTPRRIPFYLGDRAAVSTDARWVVVAWARGPLTVWDAERGVTVSEAPNRLRHVETMAAGGDPPTLVTLGADGAQAWDARTGQRLRALDRDADEVVFHGHGAVSPDGSTAAFAGLSGQVAVRPLPTTTYRAPWCYVRPLPVRELATADARFRALMGRARARVAEGRHADAARTLREAGAVPGFARHPEVREVWAEVGAHGRRAGLLGAWAHYHLNGDGVFTRPPLLALGQEDALIATARWTGEVDLWDFRAGEREYTFDRGEEGHAEEMRFALDGRLLLVRTNAGTVRRLSLVDGRKQIFTDELGFITSFALSASGDTVLIGDGTGTLRLRDLPRGDILHTVRAHRGEVRAVALGPDGRHAASHGAAEPDPEGRGRSHAYDGHEIRLWRLGEDRPLWTLEGRPAPERLTFSGDGSTLFVSRFGGVTAWDVATGELRFHFLGQGAVGADHTDIALDGAGRLAATRDDRSLLVWDASTGHLLRTLPMPVPPQVFALSADGTFAVCGGRDRLVRIWDLRSGRCLHTLEGHRATIARILLSADGSRLATADLDSVWWTWELAWDFDVRDADAEPGV
ncbi:protein kinase domain-containing protein [Streptomyces sp. NPDC003327]